jgi:hypothetical protein
VAKKASCTAPPLSSLSIAVELLLMCLVIRHGVYLCCNLGRFRSLVTLKMEVICSSEMSVLTGTTWCNISKHIHHRLQFYLSSNIVMITKRKYGVENIYIYIYIECTEKTKMHTTFLSENLKEIHQLGNLNTYKGKT